ncbi:hypothetical protein BJ875DRAFT_412580 [Amylocarpus encephaloides]|uniref:Uncharacterized protein n=1 Tax=Amylocarpus encephaloides TaxID=45428 RepID=A0A9P7Y8L7_9HELO|nr:hypothetical protein BJ875DRAFT_412580 [Amylocarpus encephaloides]
MCLTRVRILYCKKPQSRDSDPSISSIIGTPIAILGFTWRIFALQSTDALDRSKSRTRR